MATELFTVEKVIDTREPWMADERFLASRKVLASRDLGDMIMDQCAVHTVIQPDPDGPTPHLVRHRWSVGIISKREDTEALVNQIADAHRAGMMRAAGIASRYSDHIAELIKKDVSRC